MAATSDSPVPATPAADFASVFAVLKPNMTALDGFLHRQLEAFEPEIREMADYCIDTSGKRIRPALVFLAGWQGEGVIKSELVQAAAVVELVHLATLVHDDIMDEADLRRSRQTASRAYGPEAAVLLGDALFAHALHLAAQFPTTAVCAAVADFFGEEKRIGKTLGTDLASGKLTLPLLELAERLPAEERVRLEAEITGDRTPDPSLRIQQMRELGVFDTVAQAVHTEVELARGALAAFGSLAPTDKLLRLGHVLQAQVSSLRR